MKSPFVNTASNGKPDGSDQNVILFHVFIPIDRILLMVDEIKIDMRHDLFL